MSPVFMAPATGPKPALVPAAAPVEFTTRELEGKLHLLAANKSDRVQTVRFAFPGRPGQQAEVLYENRRAAVEQGELTDQFGPFVVHLYRFE